MAHGPTTPKRTPATRIAAVVLLLSGPALPAAAQERPDRGREAPVVRRIDAYQTPPSGGWSPLAVSLLPASSVPPEDHDIGLLRINLLAGRHRSLAGLDVGLVANDLTAGLTGVQVAGFVNTVSHSEAGLQIAGLLNGSRHEFTGLQLGLVLNRTDGEHAGAQIGLVNRAAALSGLQVGFLNSVERGQGVQIGVFNFATVFEGLQIGLSNVNRESSVPFFPLINFAF